MEARQEFRGRSISKAFVAIVLVIVALGLGVMSAYVAKGLTGSAAATQTNSVQTQQHVLRPATSLRQDNDYPVLPAAPQRTAPLRYS